MGGRGGSRGGTRASGASAATTARIQQLQQRIETLNQQIAALRPSATASSLAFRDFDRRTASLRGQLTRARRELARLRRGR